VEDPRPRLSQQSRLQIPEITDDAPRARECLAGTGRPAPSALAKPLVKATAAGAVSPELTAKGKDPVGGPLSLAAAAPQPELKSYKGIIDVDGELTKSENEVLIGWGKRRKYWRGRVGVGSAEPARNAQEAQAMGSQLNE